MLDPDIRTADALHHLSMTESDPWSVDRRRFLQLIGMGVGAGAIDQNYRPGRYSPESIEPTS